MCVLKFSLTIHFAYFTEKIAVKPLKCPYDYFVKKNKQKIINIIVKPMDS